MSDNFSSIGKLCDDLKLGVLTEEPEPIDGGFSHRMFAVTTTQGKYAVKVLNPQKFSIQSLLLAEQIARIAAKSVHAVPAKIINDKIIHKVNKQSYLVFDWIEGQETGGTTEHCKVMGAVLADIHTTDFSAVHISDKGFEKKNSIDWNFYLQKGKSCNAPWVNSLSENIVFIDKCYSQAIEASSQLASESIISHRNLDYRNVIWNGYTPYIIDWEESWLVNPFYDYAHTAILWAKDKNLDVYKDKFFAFSNSYKNKNKLAPKNWKTVLQTNYIEPLDWLEFSMKRSLKMNCTDPKEQQMGTEHTEYMIYEAIQYSSEIELLYDWLIKIWG